MTSPVALITMGAVAGIVAGVMSGGGGLSRSVADGLFDNAASFMREMNVVSAPSPTATPAAADPAASHFVFSACLHKSGDSVEGTLRNLLEFHEHGATLALVGCLLDGDPRRFCSATGRAQAADAMEIYYWSRDDARRTSPAHGLALKIRTLDQDAGAPSDKPDLFALTWSGPDDRAILARLRQLAADGYLDVGAFAFSGRAELREALRGVAPTASPCAALASGG